MTFPCDDYTPFGYLANPFHRATSWSATEAGLLKSFDDAVGFGWVEPTARKPAFELGLALAIRWQDRLYQTRSDFARLGLHSRHHSSRLFSYDFALDDVSAALSFALTGRDALVGRLAFAHPAGLPRAFEVILLARLAGDRAASAWHVQSIEGGWLFRDGASGRDFVFAIDGTVGQPLSPRELARLAPDLLSASRVAAGLRIQGSLNVGDTWSVSAALLRDTRDATAAHRIAAAAPSVIAERREEDDAFYAETALPMGDWPSEWKRGWVYDLETTRACIYPAGGVFHDEWPSWMIPWPRVVVAEGCLDANRFGYAAPKRALRLARTIFVDATAANVPCVFQGGEPNMVAKDGAICGTSPAWCLPFYNLWLLYARTGDHAWLGELIPHLEAYLDFWLRERTDEEGWIVYKCTWEAGEDCTPRLDPAEEGDEVVSRFVRPVELQATFSQSARILSRFAGEVGDDARAQHWDAIAA
ncbi:MAG TPA: hypothetical protein VFZ25_01935, partial [Chloroflexota bacterium]|nr:hypothetical protein [Chloroflexota bacterium]